MEKVQEFTRQEAQQYAKNRGKNTRFFVNVFGWSVYFTLKPTFATPTGKNKNFKSTQIFKPI